MFRTATLQLAATTLLLLHSTAFSQSPQPFRGLQESATISTDGEGIAHLRANNEHDLYFLQGWTHARERLFQMDYFRHVASGTVAELVGPAGLPTDVTLRTIGLRRAAERSLAAATERTRGALEAYAEGVNAWMASHPLPLEYGALELTRVAPWTPLDSVAVGKLIAFQQSFDDDTVATVAFLNYQGAFGAARANALFHLDLWRSAGFDSDATVPDATGSAAPVGSAEAASAEVREASEARIKLMREHLEHVSKVPVLRGALSREARGGSNLWAVSGQLTRDGRPLVANDPHVSLSIPALFYPMGLELEEEPVFGGSIAGAPGIIHGYNRHLAWGTTNSFTDVTDWFNEQVVPDAASPSGLSSIYRGSREPLLPIPQVFRYNVLGDGKADVLAVAAPPAVPPVTLVMPRRDGGPIVRLDPATGVALSVQWVGFGPTQELEAFMMINRARNRAEFTEALQRFDAGAQNFVYADVDGNIAFFSAGEVPVREDLQGYRVGGAPPWFVRNGQGGNEWLAVQHRQPNQATPHEIVPYDEMPQLVNPAAGWFVNANNDPLGVTGDNNPVNDVRPGGGLRYLAYSFNPGMRAHRINTRLSELLATGDRRISFEQMQAVQADHVLRDAEVLKPYLIAAFDRAATSGVPELVALGADPRVIEAAGRLRAWNGSTPTSSVEATIYAAWRARMIARVIDTPLGPLPKPDEQDSIRALRYMLDNFATLQGVGHSGIDFFAAPGIGGTADDRRDYALLKSLREGLDVLAGLFGGSTSQSTYLWGALHRVQLTHPLGGPLSVSPVPTDGGFQTVDPGLSNVRAAARQDFVYSFGAGHRSVYELAPEGNRGASIWAGGTSGDPTSAGYARFVGRWVANQSIPLLLGKQEVKRSGADLEHYVPMP